MADDVVLYSADWWPPNAGDNEPAAIEVERTDPAEIAVTIRGRSGAADHGTFYVTPGNAHRLADALWRVAEGKEDPDGE